MLEMPVRIFTIPFDPEQSTFHDAELNAFLRTQRVEAVHPQFFTFGNKPFWSVLVHFQPLIIEAGGEVRPALNDAEKSLFDRLRQWRREKGEELNLPVFLIATNLQLEMLVKRLPRSLEELKAVPGFGRKRIQKFGKELVGLLEAAVARPTAKEKASNSTAPMESRDPGEKP
jgi:superfamily II DNA helicase RecQ